MPSVLENVLAALIDTDMPTVPDSIAGGGAFWFHASPADPRVYEAGMQAKAHTEPSTQLVVGAEDARDGEVSNKLVHVLPFTVRCFWGKKAMQSRGTMAASGATAKPTRLELRTFHLTMLADLKKHLMRGTRNLEGAAIPGNMVYTGRGSKLLLLDEDSNPAEWGFEADFQVQYRHVTQDPSALTA